MKVNVFATSRRNVIWSGLSSKIMFFPKLCLPRRPQDGKPNKAPFKYLLRLRKKNGETFNHVFVRPSIIFEYMGVFIYQMLELERIKEG